MRPHNIKIFYEGAIIMKQVIINNDIFFIKYKEDVLNFINSSDLNKKIINNLNQFNFENYKNNYDLFVNLDLRNLEVDISYGLPEIPIILNIAILDSLLIRDYLAAKDMLYDQKYDIYSKRSDKLKLLDEEYFFMRDENNNYVFNVPLGEFCVYEHTIGNDEIEEQLNILASQLIMDSTIHGDLNILLEYIYNH